MVNPVKAGEIQRKIQGKEWPTVGCLIEEKYVNLSQIANSLKDAPIVILRHMPSSNTLSSKIRRVRGTKLIHAAY